MTQAIAHPVLSTPSATGRFASLEAGRPSGLGNEFEQVLTEAREPLKKASTKPEVRDKGEEVDLVEPREKSQEEEPAEDTDLLKPQETAVVIEAPIQKEPHVEVSDPLFEDKPASDKKQASGAEAVASSSAQSAGDSEALLKLLGVSQVIAKPVESKASAVEAGIVSPAASGGAMTNSNTTSAGASNPPLPPSSNLEPNMARVARALQNAIQHKGGTVTLRMSPPELGMVRVDVTVKAGVVSVRFQADHESIQSLMNRELSQLRQALQRQGLTVDRLEVQNRGSSSESQNQNQNQNHQPMSDGRSRGEYARPDDETGETETTESRFEEELNEVV